jgi:hypothetical protein
MIQHQTKAARARMLAARGKAKPAIAQLLKMRSDELDAALSRSGKRGRVPSENVHALTVRLPSEVWARVEQEVAAHAGESSRNDVIVAALRQALIDEV